MYEMRMIILLKMKQEYSKALHSVDYDVEFLLKLSSRHKFHVTFTEGENLFLLSFLTMKMTALVMLFLGPREILF